MIIEHRSLCNGDLMLAISTDVEIHQHFTVAYTREVDGKHLCVSLDMLGLGEGKGFKVNDLGIHYGEDMGREDLHHEKECLFTGLECWCEGMTVYRNHTTQRSLFTHLLEEWTSAHGYPTSPTELYAYEFDKFPALEPFDRPNMWPAAELCNAQKSGIVVRAFVAIAPSHTMRVVLQPDHLVDSLGGWRQPHNIEVRVRRIEPTYGQPYLLIGEHDD